MSQRTGLSFPTVKKALETLERLQIVRERTGNQRNRVYAYEAYLMILNDE